MGFTQKYVEEATAFVELIGPFISGKNGIRGMIEDGKYSLALSELTTLRLDLAIDNAFLREVHCGSSIHASLENLADALEEQDVKRIDDYLWLLGPMWLRQNFPKQIILKKDKE